MIFQCLEKTAGRVTRPADLAGGVTGPTGCEKNGEIFKI